MVNLDNLGVYERADPSGMRAHLRRLPAQCRKAWQEAASFPLPARYCGLTKVVVLGMGGSGIGAELLRPVVSDATDTLLLSHRDYGLPASVDERTLVIASSYSGMTEETLDGFSRALHTKCEKLALTTGGKLKAMADSHGVPVFPIAYTAPPRAALGYSLLALAGLLQKAGAIPDLTADVAESFTLLDDTCARLSEEVPAQDNPAKALAQKLSNRLPVIYGAGITGPVAYRWKTQLNENAKFWAFSETLPELNHNSVSGYVLPQEVKAMAFVVMLSAPVLHQKHIERFGVTGEILEQHGIPHTTVIAEGKSRLAQVFSLLALGDWT
ncbi:MAG: bifunctional phosphoglucose/phosphomannose isomerase, partial [Chloroflexi bacterium]|nr:bifunctional phosphoglucose/phosphomannose isomerase [Chloroflexota bacterium]